MTRLQKARRRIRHLLKVIRHYKRTVVIHGTDPSHPRPATSKPVLWVGSAAPAHALEGDVWERVG